MSELLPCPCGFPAELHDDGDVGNPLQIRCTEHEWCIWNTDLYPRESKEKLIKEWNTRADKAHYLQMAVDAAEEIKKTAIKADSVFYINAAIEAIKQRFSEE